MRIKFKELENADLIIDAIYEGGNSGNISDEVLTKLMKCGNSGGFRIVGTSNTFDDIKYIVLFSTGEDIDWKDVIDYEIGRVIYHGDNKKPGKELHNTKKKGNLILKEIFELLSKGERSKIPPIFIFTKVKGRDVRFRGLLVPGDERISPKDQLVAFWSSKSGQRFQNYQAYFTILDVARIDRNWLNDLNKGNSYNSQYVPKVWKDWVDEGIYKPLIAKRTVEYRKKEDQLPNNKSGKEIIKIIIEYFKNAYKFEECAASIVKMMDSNVIECNVTQSTKDGGKDCIGKYRVGPASNGVNIDFIVEAKRYNNSPVGVKGTSRLISRLKNNDFGILVTTSYLTEQAYKEIKEDKRPIIVISAIDIVDILNKAGYKTKEEVLGWLKKNF